MAGNESKRVIRLAQPRQTSNWQLAVAKTSSQHSAVSTQPKQDPRNQKRKRSRRKRNKLSAWRRVGRRAYRIEDIRGKTLDFVEFYTSVDFHCLDVRFLDKTALTFTIDPGFIVEAEQCDWKTGNMRRLRRWRRIRAASC